jgi:hypothetical protein
VIGNFGGEFCPWRRSRLCESVKTSDLNEKLAVGRDERVNFRVVWIQRWLVFRSLRIRFRL